MKRIWGGAALLLLIVLAVAGAGIQQDLALRDQLRVAEVQLTHRMEQKTAAAVSGAAAGKSELRSLQLQILDADQSVQTVTANVSGADPSGVGAAVRFLQAQVVDLQGQVSALCGSLPASGC